MRKKILISTVTALLAASITLTSCLGSFGLTSRLKHWNENVSDKFINELVFIGLCIVPVYEVCAIADLLVLNSIEFWSGESLLDVSETKVVEGNDGLYTVERNPDGYVITSQTDGSVVFLDYDELSQQWTYRVADGQPVVLMTFVDSRHVRVPGPDGQMHTVEVSAQGVMAYRHICESQVLMAYGDRK